MKNLKELQEKYSKYTNGLGHIRWGGKEYFEINSDKPLKLNGTTGRFILNDKGEVQLYEILPWEEKTKVYTKKGEVITEEQFDLETINLTMDEMKVQEYDVTIEDNVWWGKTLENYYPYPYYPDKQIKGFTIMKEIPLFELFEYCDLDEDDLIRSTDDYEIAYTKEQCLNLPEFFKPIYK